MILRLVLSWLIGLLQFQKGKQIPESPSNYSLEGQRILAEASLMTFDKAANRIGVHAASTFYKNPIEMDN